MERNYDMSRYEYVKTFDEIDLMKVMPEDEIQSMFGSYDYDKFFALIDKYGQPCERRNRDLNLWTYDDVIEYKDYLIGVRTSVMGNEEWELFKRIR